MRRRSSRPRIRRGAARSTIGSRKCALSRSATRCIGCEHYRFDGLRLDAVHAIVETGAAARSWTSSAARSASFAAATGRTIHLVLENDDNRASLLDPRTDPPQGKYRAQWNDDYHHAWHVLLTGERKGYYQDYACTPARHIARVLAAGFAYQGEVSASSRAAGGAANPPAACRRRRSSIFCRTTTRSATGLSAIASPRKSTKRRSRPLCRHAARPDAAAHVHGRGMGIDEPVPVLLRFSRGPRRSGTQGPTRGIQVGLCRVRRRRPRSAGGGDVSLGGARLGCARHAAGTAAACAGARAAGDPAQGHRAAPRRRGIRICAGRRGGADGQLAARRRQRLVPLANLSKDRAQAARGMCRPGARSGAARRRTRCRPGRCSGASERDDAALHPDRDLSPAAHVELRLRPTLLRSCLI